MLGGRGSSKRDRSLRANPVSLTMNRESVWRILLAIKSDTNPAASTHEKMKLSPSIALTISFGGCDGLRTSQLLLMCVSPSPVKGAGIPS